MSTRSLSETHQLCGQSLLQSESAGFDVSHRKAERVDVGEAVIYHCATRLFEIRLFNYEAPLGASLPLQGSHIKLSKPFRCQP